MDVDIPRERVGILRLESAQPQNTRHYGVPARRIRQDNFTNARRSLNTVPGGALSPIFSGSELAQWRVPAASPIAETELGGGHRINGHDIAAVEEG